MPKAWLEDTRKAWEREAKARGRFAYSDGPLTVSATVRVGVEWWEYLGGVDTWIELCCALIRKPTIAGTAIGRNCSMFDALRRWAGKPENRGNDVMAAAMSINEEIGRLHGKAPMDQSEVAAIARSVDRKRREWIAKGSYYSPEQRTLWGHTERGRKDSWPGKVGEGGRKR